MNSAPPRFYQYFLGRDPTANLIDHPGAVFTRLIKKDFQPLLDLGITHLYLLGLFDNRGPILVQEEARQDISNTPHRLPSPFALIDHSRPLPDLGSLPEFLELKDHLHGLGFKLILDFIPNHTSTSHPWVQDHPEFYVFDQNQPVREFSGDVFKLNYQNENLRSQMISILEQIASWGVDGVRVDMAHLVPLDFWQSAIQTIKRNHPEFFFAAEVYPPSPFQLETYHQHLEVGFDALYHGLLYNNLKSAINDHQLNFLVDHLNYASQNLPLDRLISYFANHDDPCSTSDATFLPALFALILLLPSPSLIYNGSLSGFTRRLAHHYFDQLPSDPLSPTLDPQLERLFHLSAHSTPSLSKASLNLDLVEIQLTLDSKPHLLYLNLTSSPKPHPQPDSQSLISPHPISQLLPGMFDLVIA